MMPKGGTTRTRRRVEAASGERGYRGKPIATLPATCPFRDPVAARTPPAPRLPPPRPACPRPCLTGQLPHGRGGWGLLLIRRVCNAAASLVPRDLVAARTPPARPACPARSRYRTATTAAVWEGKSSATVDAPHNATRFGVLVACGFQYRFFDIYVCCFPSVALLLHCTGLHYVHTTSG